MTTPILPLLAANLRGWLSAKGFVLVVAAALVPLVLTGAWAATHRADVAVDRDSLTWSPEDVVEGTNVTFRAVVRNVGGGTVGPFNSTLSVGTVFNGRFLQSAGEVTEIEALEDGASRELTLTWTARPGVYYVLAEADLSTEDRVAEVDEFNNQVYVPLAVGYRPPNASEAPSAPGNLTGPENATAAVDLSITLAPVTGLRPDEPANLVATVRNDGTDEAENATVTVRVGRMFFGRFSATQSLVENVTLAPGASRDLTLAWTAAEGAWWAEAFVNATSARDADGADNHAARAFVVDPAVGEGASQPDPPEKLTIKDFYVGILSVLHLRVLIPFIGLFYAAGVIADERERGTLAYVLTRPVPRWVLPVAKFAGSFLVAALAVTLGIVGTYLLLFQTVPQGQDLGFLVGPLLVSLLALAVYGAFFVLLGTLVERPYLIGAALVIGWETVAGNFVPWVRNLTLSQHLTNLLVGWVDAENATFRDWPEGDDAMRAVRVLVGVLAVSLLLAAYTMKRREFEL